MEEKEVKKEKKFYKKWWFWVIIAIIIIVCFTSIVMLGFSIILDEVGKLGRDIKEISEDATVYSSAGEDTLIIELRNWSNDNTEKMNQIITVVKNRISNGELQSYSKLITLAYLESNDTSEVLFIKNEYNIPEFTQIEDDSKTYILYTEYQELFNTLNQTMDGYTSLFNSIY